MKYKIQPWQHQLDAIERAKDLPHFALFMEVGTGKTGTVINILRYKMDREKRYFKTLIFAPPVVVSNWKDEFLKHSNIPESKIVPLVGSGKERLKTFLNHAYGKDPITKDKASAPAFFITNYESLLMPELFQAFLRWQPEAVVFDESHRIKNHSAKRSKLADKLVNSYDHGRPYCYILSGSPVLNSPLDLFHQFKVMDGGETFGRNYFIFRARYFEDKNAWMTRAGNRQRYFPKWEVRPGAVDEINEKIFRSGVRVTKSECLDLPEEVAVTIKCGMTGEQARNYKEMKQDYITFCKDNVATASLAIVKALRLMQITSGFLPLAPTGDEGDAAKVVYSGTEKEEYLKELLEELTPHSKVVVWATWRENYATIRKVCEDIGVRYVEVHGGISRAKQDSNIDAFKSDEGIRVFISNPASGGVGINLVCANYDIYYSRTFSLEHWIQARARIHRGGQTRKVVHFDLVCEKTIDELVVSKLSDKNAISEKLLNQNILQDIEEELCK